MSPSPPPRTGLSNGAQAAPTGQLGEAVDGGMMSQERYGAAAWWALS